MKRIGVGVLLLSVVGFSAIGAGDVWQELRIAKSEVGKEIASAFAYGSFSTSRVRDTFRKASPEVRAALVENVLIATKAYVNSPAFATEYAALREEAKPKLEERPSIDDELKERREQRQAELDDAKRNVAETPAEYRKAAEDGYKAAVQAMKQMDTPEFRKMERQGLEMERKGEQEQYQQDLAQWEQNYPNDPKAFVKQRLQEFLDATDGVDYGAKTAAKWGKQRFVNETYESKGSDWKLAYRAGKEPTEKARAFAKSWLAELR
ncbi:MAG: hypothetical protein ACTHQM_16065 [Thermoanaerobaculia bacterium]